MKNKKIAAILSLTLVLTVNVAVVPAFAEAVTEEVKNAEDESDEKTKGEDFAISVDDKEVQVKNDTDTNVAAEYQADGTLTITEADGTEHTFEKVSVSDWKEPVLSTEFGFFYVNYQDETGKDVELVEKADEKVLEESITVYATDNVNIRKDSRTDAASLFVTTVGDECKVVAVVPGWLKLECGNVEGYAYHSYFTEDKEKADAELQKRREAQKAAQAAAAQAKTSAGPEAVYEVSREAYDDCDGSGHGYYEITYSDGSVVRQEY